MKSMDAIILAGGLGTRLRSVVPDHPKPLAPVGGRPFLDILLEQLAGFPEIRNVVLAVGYRAEAFHNRYFGNRRFGFEIHFSTEQTPLGTGGALLRALEQTATDDVLVLNGDSYVEFDLAELKRTYVDNHASIAMIVREVEDAGRYGSVDFEAVTAKVLGFREKAGTAVPGYINAGVYLIRRASLPADAGVPMSFEREILPAMLGDVRAIAVRGKFIDIGIPETYALAGSYLG